MTDELKLHEERVQRENQYQRELRTSIAVHAIVFIAALVSSLVLPKKPINYTPSIRVDLVALPDLKKSDLATASPDDLAEVNQKVTSASKALKRELELAKKLKAFEAEPDNNMAMKKEKPSSKNAKKDSLKSAIDRIKALTDIENEVKKSTTKTKISAKGNTLSKGNAVSGTPGTDTNAYIGKMQAKLADNWNLPVWLSKEDLSAIVRIRLDAQGFVLAAIVEKTSGNKQFDDFALKTIRIAQPFGAAPDELVDTGVRLGFPL